MPRLGVPDDILGEAVSVFPALRSGASAGVDDLRRAGATHALLSALTLKRPGFVCREVAVELSWILDRAYGFSRDRIARLFEDLVGTAELHVEACEDVIRAAEGYRRGGAGFSDGVIAAAAKRPGASANPPATTAPACACDTVIRLCVRAVPSGPVSPWPSPYSSVGSAASTPAPFTDFIGNLGRSDFCDPCIVA